MANFPMGRRAYSRSPPRHDFHGGDHRDRDARYRHDVHYERSYDGRGWDDGYSRRDASSHRLGHRSRGPHDYDGMYDDGYEDDRHHPARYEDDRHRDRRLRRSRSPAHRRRSRSYSPTREAGKPSDTVILEGVPFGLSASELREIVLSDSIASEFPDLDLRVSSSKGHRRAFIQFALMDHAVAFVKEHFPRLHLELQHSTDEVPDGKFEVYPHYARAREDADARGPSSGTWECPACDYANFNTRNKCKMCGEPQSASNWRHSLTGMADAADVPAQILVVYPLAPFINEEMLANDMKRLELEKPDPTKNNADGAPKLKSTAPNGNPSGYGARPDSLHRVFLMRDANTDESFKYGFAEFWTLEDAAAAMTKFRMARTFTVGACAVTVSTIHMGVFVPEEREVTPAIAHMSFNPLFNPALRVRYRDPQVYPSQKVVTSKPPSAPGTGKTRDEDADARKSKKRKAEANAASSTAKKAVPMAGHMAMWQKKHDELRQGHGKAEGSDGATASDPSRPTQQAASGNSAKPDPKAPIKISLSGSIKLNAPAAPAADAAPSPDKATDEQAPSAENIEPQAVTPPDDGAVVSYVDRDRFMCLICMRKYKSMDEVNIHEKSRNHKTATENDELVKTALPRIAARDKRQQKQAPEEDESAAASQYRDRAKERRTAYSQPAKPSQQPAKTKTGGKPPGQKENNAAAAAAAKPAQSKGAGMLAKMGWAAGAGLGAHGEGRTEVVQTDAYQEGVGLGAEGGNLGDAARLAERKTRNDYADYVNSVQDKARQRYSNMG